MNYEMAYILIPTRLTSKADRLLRFYLQTCLTIFNHVRLHHPLSVNVTAQMHDSGEKLVSPLLESKSYRKDVQRASAQESSR